IFLRGERSDMFRRRGNGTCTHTMCDIIARNKPERNIGFVCESIALFERHFGDEYKEEVREMSLDALSKFGPGTPFEKDERMLPVYRILGRYSKSMTISELYDRLYEKNLFEKSAQFFVDWADAHMTVGNPTRAAQIMAHADSAVGTDHPLLEMMKEKIEKAMNSQMVAQEDMSVPPPPLRPSKQLDAQIADLNIGSLVGRPPPQQTAEVRRILAPIQAPVRTMLATTSQKEFPPLPSTSSISSSLDEKLVDASKEEWDDENKENVAPPLRPVNPVSFLLPNIIETAPISPDIISPSLAQMKPGRPNNFILQPVFTFADAAKKTH
ncbi:hypothetical protein PFISCL1PPCAC_5379, partial [Pristionchus fissidentatus]